MPEALSVIQTSLVHNIHRRATTMLAEAAANPAVPAGAIASLREFLVLNLEHHHTTEDDDLWPMINAADPGAAIAMSSLSGEHHILDEALKTILAVDLRDRREFVGAAALVRNIVHRHLGDEEPILFPTLREHITAEAWAGFARYVTQTAPSAERHLMIGFTDLVGTDEQIRAVLGGVPPAALAEMRQRSQAEFELLRGGS